MSYKVLDSVEVSYAVSLYIVEHKYYMSVDCAEQSV